MKKEKVKINELLRTEPAVCFTLGSLKTPFIAFRNIESTSENKIPSSGNCETMSLLEKIGNRYIH